MRLLFTVCFIGVLMCENVSGQIHTMKLKENKDFFQSVENTEQFIISADGETDSITTLTDYRLKFRVVDSSNEEFVLQSCFLDMRLVNMIPDGDFEYKPEKASAYDLVSSIMANIVDQPFTIRLSKNGSVLEVKELNDVINGAIKNLPEDMTSQFEEMFIGFYGSEILSRNIEVMTTPLPQRSDVDDNKWIVSQGLRSVQDEELNVAYSINDFSSDTYEIEGIGTMDKERHKLGTNDSEVKAVSNGSFSLQASMNRATGWFRNGEVTEDVEGRLKVSGEKDLKNWIPFHMISKTTITGEE